MLNPSNQIDSAFVIKIKRIRDQLLPWIRTDNPQAYCIYDYDMPELPFRIERFETVLYITYIHQTFDDATITILLHYAQLATQTLGLSQKNAIIKIISSRAQSPIFIDIPLHMPTVYSYQEGDLHWPLYFNKERHPGIILEHRYARAFIYNNALNKNVLSLFSYTGSFANIAAIGGARTTLSVNPITAYTEFAQTQLNTYRLSQKDHKAQTENPLDFIASQIKKPMNKRTQFDIITINAPHFFRPRGKSAFTLRQQGISLLTNLLTLLHSHGIILFTSNDPSFHLSRKAFHNHASVHNVSKQFTSPDYTHMPHFYWIIEPLRNKKKYPTTHTPLQKKSKKIQKKKE